jgi:CBS domain-containing protein
MAEKGVAMQARDVMSDGVMSVSADATLLDAARLLVDCHVSALPVVNDAGLMLGIVSEADLVRPQPGDSAAGWLRRGAKVADVMTHHVVCAGEDTPLAELGRLMSAHRVKRLPIVRDGSVVGIVTRRDLLRALVALEGPDDESGRHLDRDQQLRSEIAAACRGRSWAKAQEVDIVVSRGVAHLWGVAPSDMVRKAYEVATGNIPGVKKVQMHMHVVPPPALRIGL